MKTILVTGGLGFIGSHTCIELIEREYNVYIIDSLINSHIDIINRIKSVVKINDQNKLSQINYFKGDVCDYSFLNSVFKTAEEKCQRIDGVIHFSGLKSVSDSFKKPILYWQNNVCGTINLINVMQNNNCSNLIFSSSASVYSDKNKSPIAETAEIKPKSIYGKTKACIEEILNDLFKSSINWKIISLRYFNPIGAHPSGLIGEMPVGEPNNIFPLINKVAAKKKHSLEIFGKDWNSIDGTAVRDYIHIMDLVEGHIMAYEYMAENNSQICSINLGTGKGTTVLELINKFQEVNNLKVPYLFSKRREGDLEECIADNSLAKALLDWKPKRNIRDMCRDGWKWQVNCTNN